MSEDYWQWEDLVEQRQQIDPPGAWLTWPVLSEAAPLTPEELDSGFRRAREGWPLRSGIERLSRDIRRRYPSAASEGET